MSFGVDVSWRKWVARRIVSGLEDGSKVLDVGTGTGDLVIEMAREAEKMNKKLEFYGIDANEDMLRIAKKKIEGLNVVLEKGDALKMKYPDDFFDAVVSGFAIRNFDNLERFSSELGRVIKKGGTFAIMDMAFPKNRFQRAFFGFYFRIIRFFGSFVDKESYDWLAYSVEHFDFERFKRFLESNGLKNVNIKPLSFNITYVAIGTK